VEGIYFRDGVVYATLPSFLPPPFHLIKAEDIGIRGIHNLENAMASSLIALICGVPVDVIGDVLREFKGLEHRLEFVREINGVSFVNDSKGTNVGAVAKSLEGFRNNIVLIMGGREKKSNFTVLRDLVKEKVKALILLGEAREKIAGAIGDITETVFVDSLKEAVEVSMSKASAGDVVLLSPGCTSFDMFANFEERGRKFKEAVNKI